MKKHILCELPPTDSSELNVYNDLWHFLDGREVVAPCLTDFTAFLADFTVFLDVCVVLEVAERVEGVQLVVLGMK